MMVLYFFLDLVSFSIVFVVNMNYLHKEKLKAAIEIKGGFILKHYSIKLFASYN